jgi:23S rRNA A2030 N6-methylase RlmJ
MRPHLTIAQDPFYYIDSHPTQGGMSEKKKKEKRKFKNYKNGLMGSKMYQAPGVSPHDNAILASVRRRSWHLDMSLFHWCGFRFGWSVIIGLVPV